jgi:dihydrofolate reductase
MASEALLLGRTTYEGFAAAWPSRTGEFADKFNNMRKYVVSTTLDSPEWNNSVVIADNVPGEVAKLREQEGGDILVNGSAQLVGTLAENDLIDEHRLMVFPVILGSGKRLVPDGTAPASLRLTDSRPAGETLILIYERAPQKDGG